MIIMNNKDKKQINIELSDDSSSGIYSNLSIVNHSSTEFVLDFINIMPGMAKAKVKSRVILAPQNCKRLLATLMENVKKYEENFGQIKDIGKSKLPINFGGPKAEA
tara:strand:+ start:189 stop:506 length:318 start_codon:yes stop_codon:yes gene_type:complete